MCHRLHDLRAHPWPARQGKQACVHTARQAGRGGGRGHTGARRASGTRARGRCEDADPLPQGGSTIQLPSTHAHSRMRRWPGCSEIRLATQSTRGSVQGLLHPQTAHKEGLGGGDPGRCTGRTQGERIGRRRIRNRYGVVTPHLCLGPTCSDCLGGPGAPPVQPLNTPDAGANGVRL